jgi:hypothetical protein
MAKDKEHVAITREEAIELLEALGLPTDGTNEELAREMHKAAFWVDALGRNRDNRELVASLTPTPEFLRPKPKKARRVAAAEPNLGAHAPRVEYPQSALELGRRDEFGVTVPGTERPVVLRKGTPPEQWTERQRQDNMQRRLGPRFYPGTEAPPKGDEIYLPSPNDVTRYDEASGQWVEKNPYREI